MENEADIHGVEVPDFKKDYHGHPNYRKIYFSLLAFFLFSLFIGYFTNSTVALVLIFGAALIKTVLVVGNFMHLKFEPWLVWVIFFAVVFIVFTFYWGVFIDITAVKLELAK